MNTKNNLVFKWAPSIGGSHNREAEALAKYLGLTPKQYRKYLSKARSSLKIVEQKMCSKDWENIDYSSIPSRALLVHSNAFRRNDSERYSQYLKDAHEGKVKMNTSCIYPHEVFLNYETGSMSKDEIESIWKNLPDYCNNTHSIVVADVSGSMWGVPLAVSVSLAVYFAERNEGYFKNKAITFSSDPAFIDFSKCNTIIEKFEKVRGSNWAFSTNLLKVFDVLLNTSVAYKLPKESMPSNIYIISDMQFDSAVNFTGTTWDAISQKYEKAGYPLPNVIFWNVNDYGNVPVTARDSHTALVSGYSPNTFRVALSDNISPLSFMKETIAPYENFAKKLLGRGSK